MLGESGRVLGETERALGETGRVLAARRVREGAR